MPAFRPGRCALFAITAALLLAACSDSSGPPKPATVAVIAGAGQEATVGTSLAQPVVVEVLDGAAKPVRNVPVTWAVTEGGGSLTASSTMTDGSGHAQVGWTLGTQAGVHRITATAGSLAPAPATATGKAGPPASIERVSGHEQTGTVAQLLPTPLVVRVKDAHGNNVAAAAVTFTAVAGEVTPAATSTSVEGLAQTSWRLGTGMGQQLVNATVAGLGTPVVFSATAGSAAAASLTALTLTSVAATVGQEVAMWVRAVDTHGNPVAGTTVNFSVLAGGGSVTPPTATTAADGLAQATWALSTTAGTQTARAQSPGIPTAAAVTFTATVAPAAATTIRLQPDSAQLISSDTTRLALLARDQYDNSVPVTGGTWSSSAAGVATVDNGLVRGAAPGSAIITAVAHGLTTTARVFVADAAGTINLSIAGVPTGSGSVSITGPGYARTVSAGGAFGVPAAGTYTITATGVIVGGLAYTPTPPVQTVTVTQGGSVGATVNYAVQVTPLQNDVPLTGLGAPTGAFRYYRLAVPAGTLRLTVTTTGGTGDADLYVRRSTPPTTTTFECRSWTETNNESCVLQSPAAGDWYIMLDSYEEYADLTLRAAHIAGGSIAVTVSGLPAGAVGSVGVSGPSGYSTTVTSTQTLTGLTPGSYTIVAAPVSHASLVYAPTPLSQQINVVGSETSNVPVVYALTTGGFNLFISGLHITQGIQTENGSVPLIANRSGLLRVLVRGSVVSSATPAVRVRIYHGGNLVDTRIIPAPSAAVPTTVDLGTLLNTWNTVLPASLMQPNLSVLAEVDTDNLVTETDDTDNSFPSAGTPLTLDVRTVTTFTARLVPVLQAPNTLVGDVTTANLSTYTTLAQALYPLPGTIDADVRAPYSFSGIVPASYDTIWSRLLLEIRNLRTADGSTRYYYGVIRPAYNSGGTGLGYIGAPAALGVDWPNWRHETIAHEWGHNFGRQHAPCGNPGGPDPNYPYAGGAVGLAGWDMRSNTIRNAATTFDLMSYCQPTWASDYTYNGVLNYRAGTVGAGPATAQRSLLIWGRISPEGVVLEPAFEITTRPVLPGKPGRYRITATDEKGSQLLDFSFDGEEVDHMPGVRHFSYAVPLSMLGGEAPAVLRLRGNGIDAVRRRAPAAAAAGAGGDVQLSRGAAGRVRVRWNEAAHPVLMIRDPRTGEVLSFARGGDMELATSAAELEINASDGVKSARRRMPVPR